VLSLRTKAKIIVHIVLGLRYIHGWNVTHHSLKPSNILLDEFYEPQIAHCLRGRWLNGIMPNYYGTSHFHAGPELFDPDDSYDFFGPDNIEEGKERDILRLQRCSEKLWRGNWSGRLPRRERHGADQAFESGRGTTSGLRSMEWTPPR
jgi:serine/threonine protein kinase